MEKIKITKEMKKELSRLKKWFLGRTIEGRDIIDYDWGFTAVGFLKEPSDHINKKVNKIFILDVGLTDNGKKIKKHISCDMKVNEAGELMESIKYVLGNQYDFG